MSNTKKIYQELMSGGGFSLAENTTFSDSETRLYALSEEYGKGEYRVFFFKDMFEITIRNFTFNNDFFLECPNQESLVVEYYASVSGEELRPYHQLAPNSLRVHIGLKNGTYQAIYHKNVPIISTGITFMPSFYQQHLQSKFSGEYVDPSKSFQKISYGMDFPELVALFRQIQGFSSSSQMSEKLFYEGKALEVIALVMEKAKINQTRTQLYKISSPDEENLNDVVSYIENHYAFNIQMDHLCKIACMGTSKLKTVFKEVYGCSISDFIVKKRIGQAQHLIIGSDLTIAEVAKVVGYKRSDSFSSQFKKITGLLPREFKKMHDSL